MASRSPRRQTSAPPDRARHLYSRIARRSRWTGSTRLSCMKGRLGQMCMGTRGRMNMVPEQISLAAVQIDTRGCDIDKAESRRFRSRPFRHPSHIQPVEPDLAPLADVGQSAIEAGVEAVRELPCFGY